MPKQLGPILQNSFQITQRFGQDPARYAQFGMAGHNGIDIACPTGTAVYAGINGKIHSIGNDPTGYGQYIRLFDPAQNLLIIFAHLSAIGSNLSVGQSVTKTQALALTGTTGNSTGPHLHLGVGDTDIAGNRVNRENGYDGWLDPMDMSKFTLILFGAAGGASPSTGTTTPSPTTGTTGPGGITKGSYAATSLTQEQRQWLWQQFGHTGTAPVGYGGENPGGLGNVPTSTLPTGPGGIKPGDYNAANLTQDQRQFLWEFFGFTGQSPVGFGGYRYLGATGPWPDNAKYGPYGITPGDYNAASLRQEQRQWLWEYYGHTGTAPVGYGGEPPFTPPTTPPPTSPPPTTPPPTSPPPTTPPPVGGANLAPWSSSKAPTHRQIYDKLVEIGRILTA